MTINVIGSAIGHAAGQAGCEAAPEAIRDSEYLKALALNLDWQMVSHELTEAGIKADVTSVAAFSKQTAALAQSAIQQNQKLLNIGGDHSCAIGFWSGIASANEKDMGLIWVDAHMDAHTMETTPSGNIHGMPLAVLLGHGDLELTSVSHKQPALKPEHVCLVGIRSFEPGEEKLLRDLGVRIIFMEEVLDRGIEACMADAFEIAGMAEGGFGMTIDMDGFDVMDAPAVGTPVRNGIRFDEFLPLLNQLSDQKNFLALELCEFNPKLPDNDQLTEKALVNIIRAVYKGL